MTGPNGQSGISITTTSLRPRRRFLAEASGVYSSSAAARSTLSRVTTGIVCVGWSFST